MQQLSVIARDYYTEEGVVGFYTSGESKKTFGKTGALWGGLSDVLSGSAFLLVPGIGPLFVAGPVAGQIVEGIEEASVVGRLSALGAVLYGIGVPQTGVAEYEAKIRTGMFVLIACGSPEEVEGVKAPLVASGCQGLSEYTARS
jgi:hypothetical protein